MADEQATDNGTEAAPTTSRRRLMKSIEGTAIKISVVGGNSGEVTYDFATLPAEIQAKFGPFGLSHKLGDAAAGKAGPDAEEAIGRVWDGLMAGDWSVRAPAAPKVSIKAVADNFTNLDAGEQEAAKALLTSLGIKIPGVTE